jgi:hypothetical protein
MTKILKSFGIFEILYEIFENFDFFFNLNFEIL